MTIPATPLTAPELYAMANGSVCTGEDRCHWCTAPCRRRGDRLHDDPPPVYAFSWKTRARHRNSAYVCEGCWLWGRRSITAPFLGGGFKDRQAPKQHSWLITDEGAYAILQPKQFVAIHGKIPVGPHPLWNYLLDPDRRFVLAIKGEGDNLLYLAEANDLSILHGADRLKFTFDSHVFDFSVAEIEAARQHGKSNEPGVRQLIELFGPPPVVPKEPEPPPQRGRIKASNPEAGMRNQKHTETLAISGQIRSGKST